MMAFRCLHLLVHWVYNLLRLNTLHLGERNQAWLPEQHLGIWVLSFFSDEYLSPCGFRHPATRFQTSWRESSYECMSAHGNIVCTFSRAKKKAEVAIVQDVFIGT